MGTVATSLLEGCGGCIHADIHAVLFRRGRSHREHSRSVLEGVGQARHASVIREACVAVARRQRGVEEGLPGGVVRLGLALLRLG